MHSQPDRERIRSVVEALSSLDLTSLPAWEELQTLSKRTTLDGIEVDPAAIIVNKDQFEGEMTIYVGLMYGDKDDYLETSDAFAGSFKGHFEPAGKPVVDDVVVETAPFYR
jgi:hypothetical protein